MKTIYGLSLVLVSDKADMELANTITGPFLNAPAEKCYQFLDKDDNYDDEYVPTFGNNNIDEFIAACHMTGSGTISEEEDYQRYSTPDGKTFIVVIWTECAFPQKYILATTDTLTA